MKELIEFIAKSIVNLPDEVVVTEETSDQGIWCGPRKLIVDDERCGGRRGHGVEESNADGATNLLAGVQDRGCHTGIVVAHREERGRRQWHKDQAHAEAEDDHGGQDVANIGTARGQANQQAHTHDSENKAGTGDVTGAKAGE